ncbi:FAD-binding oxidoreductase [[Phormidium] sp. ETS-05]|uniref:NAD(P)/FAD-dependent oxidoreductase n=1 Tax=[Phormidium] sp. ETS-05 TaxID=222819 RepID=UPI0018EF1A54|nr:FAD-dependent oxidoreductase [[Phormidium] sp. ETS-05]
MTKIAIIGCGVVGGAIAYELSQLQGAEITVLDQNGPASGATSASLGVIMGVSSQKVKGRAWQLRSSSLQRYDSLIAELEVSIGSAASAKPIRYNRHGIMMLCFCEEEMAKKRSLADLRRQQGFNLEILSPQEIRSRCPQLGDLPNLVGGVYSPDDRQVDPVALTEALVTAAKIRGVDFQFGVKVTDFVYEGPPGQQQVTQIHFVTQRTGVALTPNPSPKMGEGEAVFPSPSLGEGPGVRAQGQIDVDLVVVAAGLGSTPLTAQLGRSVDIGPVLGQALHLRLNQTLGNPDFQPVITGDDVHIVPLGGGDYWVGATVEWVSDAGELVPQVEAIETVRQQTIAFCPQLADAVLVKQWFGLRPRPQERSAPIISPLSGYTNVILATGHYRNGILLAPATALEVLRLVTSHKSLVT